MTKLKPIIIKIAIVFLALLYATILFIEYDRYQKDLPMLFNIKATDINVYNDGEVEINYGLGYKTITYDRDSITGKEFGTLFLHEKNSVK